MGEFSSSVILDILNFFKSHKRDENTITFLFGDHGARAGAAGDFRNTNQGRLEEYMPFYSIVLPPGFKHDYPELYNNIKANTDVLTSHFDFHATLKHVLSYPDLPSKHKYGQSLFTKINPETRTCNQTGIPEKFCFCAKAKKRLPSDTKLAKQLATKAVRYINNLVSKRQETKRLCAQLSLVKVISIEYEQTEEETNYNIIFQTSPNSATYDVNLKKNLKTKMVLVNPEISRTNLYRNQPFCIHTKYPKLAFFCYCKSFLEQHS